MPRDYGTTNIMPYSTAPAVGAVGDQYYNTSQRVTYISDGTVWLPVPTGAYGGWIPSLYTWTALADNILMVQDNNAFSSEYQFYNTGTRVRWSQSGVVGYGTVVAEARGTTSGALPVGATYDTTTDVFTTGAAHGLANGDEIYFSAATGGFVPGNTPYFVISVTSTTFQISATSGGAAVNMAGANGTVTVASGQVLTLAPNFDYGLVRGTTVGGPGGSAYPPQYSYALCPAFWPGWFNYNAIQNVNPLNFPVGFSTQPSVSACQFRVDGNMLTYFIRTTTAGTSNANTFQVSLPVRAASVTNGTWRASATIVDNGAVQVAAGAVQVSSGVINGIVCKGWDGTNTTWTTTGSKNITACTLIYPI